MPGSSEAKRPGAYSVSTESKGNAQFYQLKVPANTTPGSTFTFSAGSRRGLTARCPPTSGPGDFLQVAVLPEPETHYTSLKMAHLTSVQETASGGARPMTESVRQANQDLLESTADSFLVTVPPSVEPGMQFLAKTPHGQQFLVTCPPNAGPNQPIRIRVPNKEPQPQEPSSESEENPPAEDFHATIKLFQIIAPEGVRPNQVLSVLVCGKRIPVTLPDNVVPGQKLKLKLPVQQVVGSIELSYDQETSKGWCRTIRMSDLKFQWVRVDNDKDKESKDKEDAWKTTKSALIRKLQFLEGNDTRMRTGTVELVPADQAICESELVHHNRTLVSYATIAHIQQQSLDEKTNWFQTICSDLTAPWETGRIKIVVRRTHLLNDSIQAIMSLGRQDMRKRWRLEFFGEPAIDSGGVMREWFQLVTEQMFNPDLGLWLSSVNNQICMRINPSSGTYGKDYALHHILVTAITQPCIFINRHILPGRSFDSFSILGTRSGSSTFRSATRTRTHGPALV